MLKEFSVINSNKIRDLNKLADKINRTKYKEVFFFPHNVYSKYLDLKIFNKKKIFVDNFLNKIKCIKPTSLKPSKDKILVVTDSNLYKTQKFNKKLNKIYFKNKFKLINKIDLDKEKKGNTNLNKLFEYYNSDKAKIYKRLIFKDKTHNYGKFYNKYFRYYKNRKINILEIGSYEGASAAAFLNYFKNAKIVCIDIDHKNFLFKSRNIKLIKANYMKKNQINNFCKNYQNYFDIIIDDGGHYKSHILNNMKNFYQCLKKNKSLYVIEDFGLKFDYLNDMKSEHNIFRILNFYRKKKFFKSKILNKNFQQNMHNNLTDISVYQGDWTKYKKKISDICFLKFNIS
jgi:hypothetical protein